MNMPRFVLRRSGAVLLAIAILALAGCFPVGSNRAPVAGCEAFPREGYAPLSVRLDASGSYDPDGDALSYVWTLDDDTTLNGRTVTFEFAEGVHAVELTVMDSEGLIDRSAMTITARAVPDGYVVRRYEWTHDGEDLIWDAILPYDLYQMYRGRPRIKYADNYDYPAFVFDPLDDPSLEDYATVLWNQAGGNEEAFIEGVLSFVQGAIAYQADPVGLEWPLYPLETMYDAVGDCEDTAILFVSLLRARDIPSKLAYVDTNGDRIPDHVLALVPVSADFAGQLACGGEDPNILWMDEDHHAVAETAVDSGDLGLGCDPWDLETEDVIEWWSF